MLDYLIHHSVLLASILALVLIYFGVSYWAYVVLVGLVLQSMGLSISTIGIVVGVMSLFVFSFTRRFIFAWPAFTTMKLLKFLPTISKTEKEEFKQAALHAYSSQGIQDNETPNIAAGDATEKNIKDGEELVNINTAVKQELMALPKIGPVTAERIIRFRDDFGPFQSIDDLAKIKGIGPKTLERLKTRIII